MTQPAETSNPTHDQDCRKDRSGCAGGPQDAPSPPREPEDEILVVDEDVTHPTSLDRSCFVEVLASVFEVVCSGPLQERVEQFMQQHCHDFKSEAISTSDSSPPEYKHEHYVLFKKYCDDIEDLLVSRVQEQHPHFNLAQFVEECRDVLGDHMDGNNNDNSGCCDMQAEEVFDFLLSLVDFEAFRDDMISTAMHGQELQLRGSPAVAAAEE